VCGQYSAVRVSNISVLGLLVQHSARETHKIQSSTMDLSSLNVDVLLYLMGFVKPVDRFNLVLPGILKGFESVNEGMDLRRLYCNCILNSNHNDVMILYRSFDDLPDESLFKFLERLAAEGLLQKNRKLIVRFEGPRSSRFVEVICSMKNLKELHLFDYELIPEIHAHVFQSCSKITDLCLLANEDETFKMLDQLKSQLRPSFLLINRKMSIYCIRINF
jgi:hypothetical protein